MDFDYKNEYKIKRSVYYRGGASRASGAYRQVAYLESTAIRKRDHPDTGVFMGSRVTLDESLRWDKTTLVAVRPLVYSCP